MRLRAATTVLVMSLTGWLVGCGDDGMLGRLMGRRTSVELPALMSTELPFRYPPGLYLEQIQDDVTLRLVIDSLGKVVRESTTVARAARYALFDSAAVEGAAKLVFRPARRGEHRIPFVVLFPVKFRLPNAVPLPQDTAHPPAKP